MNICEDRQENLCFCKTRFIYSPDLRDWVLLIVCIECQKLREILYNLEGIDSKMNENTLFVRCHANK
jgi:hypothetical protein